MVKAHRIHDTRDLSGSFPLLVEPASSIEASAPALRDRVAKERAWIDQQLADHGAILFRGYGVASPTEFESVCKAYNPRLLDYVGGETPRLRVERQVYTSTEYPRQLQIPLHNEMSYAHRWPKRLFFFCQKPAEEGGATPIASAREILAAIPAPTRQRFIDKGVTYTRNLHGGWGLGKSWQETYETERRAEVEDYCRRAKVEFGWSGQDLWTKAHRPAVIAHEGSGELLWFNQALLWHPSTWGGKREVDLRRLLDDAKLPRNVCYGDGSPIPPEDLASVQRAQVQAAVQFRWEPGDILLLDNELVAHGRQPFTGPRRILVAMS